MTFLLLLLLQVLLLAQISVLILDPTFLRLWLQISQFFGRPLIVQLLLESEDVPSGVQELVQDVVTTLYS